MKNPACFLVNPRSGGGAAGFFLPILKERFPGSIVRCIGEDADIPALIADPDISRIIVVGGDGTFSSLLEPAVGSGKVFGILPVGTGNDLAKELGLYRLLRPRNIVDAACRLEYAQERLLDVWRCDFAGNSRFFCNYLSTGFDAAVLERFESLRLAAGKRSGNAALLRNRYLYLRAGLENVNYALPEGISARPGDGGEKPVLPRRCMTLLFPNIRSFMGLAVSSNEASPFDRRIPCLVFSSVFSYAGAFIRKWIPFKAPSIGDSSSWVIDAGDASLPLQCDGELVTMAAEGEIGIVYAGQIRVLSS